MKRVTVNGKACMREEVSGIIITSPPIPTNDADFLAPRFDAPPKPGGDPTAVLGAWQRPQDIPTDREFNAWPQHRQDELAAREHRRIREGAWIKIAGVPTWLPGEFYLWLTYYYLHDISSHPYYKECDRQEAWLWDHIVNHPRMLGIYEHTRRQDGKSHRGTNKMLHAAITTFGIHCGIQSRNEKAAEELFQRKMVPAWRNLPVWLKPKHEGKPNPASELVFQETRVNPDDPTGPKIVAGLGSKISFSSSLPGAYDHDKLRRFLNDEVGKRQQYDPTKRHDQVKRQMIQPNPRTGRSEVVGKMIATTSTDEEESDDPNARRNNGLESAKWFWNNSNPADVDWSQPYAQTPSGLIRYLRLADDGWTLDPYGKSLKKEAREEHEASLANLPTAAARLAYRRAYPLSERDAFMPDAGECEFDAAVLQATYEAAEHWASATNQGPRPYRFREAADGKAVLVPDENGPWLFVPEAIPRADRQNKWEVTGQIMTREGGFVDTKRPLQGHVYYGSTDPIHKDKKQLARVDQGSMAAAHIGWEYDPDNERDDNGRPASERPGYWISGGVIGEYRHRPDKKDDYFKQMLLAALFFGCTIFPENSGSADLSNYFDRMGCGAFIAKPPKDMPGSKAMHKQGGANPVGVVNAHRVKKLHHFLDERVATNWRYLPFPRTINDLLLFDPDNTKDFDLSSSLSLLAAKLMPSNIRVAPVNNQSRIAAAASMAF